MKSIALDGNAKPLFRARLAAQIRKVLDAARKQKLSGIGVMARPESDFALLQLYQVLHRLEPNQGWLQKGLVTLAHTLHHALSRAEHVYWGIGGTGLNWRFLAEKISDSEGSLLEDCEQSTELKRSATAQLLPIVRDYLRLAEKMAGCSFSPELAGLHIQSLPR